MGDAPRPLPWIAGFLYLSVLASGLTFDLAGLSPLVSRTGFITGLGALLAVEWAQRRFVPLDAPRWRAVALVVLRLGLVQLMTALDPAGFARALYLLMPFLVYFVLGRWASVVLAAGYLAVAALRLVPDGFRQAGPVSDLLMFAIGMVVAVSTAAVAAGQQASRRRAERLLGELERSHARLRAYAGQAAQLATATERNRLARDIHDSLGHHLTAIAIQLEKAETFRDLDPDAAGQALAHARRCATDALSDVRQSVATLRTEPLSLPAALTALADALRGPAVTIRVDVDAAADGCLAEPVKATVYRAAQEALTNARRHASAGRVDVRLRVGEGHAVLEVVDDGCGFVAAGQVSALGSPAGAGSGLAGMAERVALAGGVLHIDSAPGRGTRVHVRVPLSGPASVTLAAA